MRIRDVRRGDTLTFRARRYLCNYRGSHIWNAEIPRRAGEVTTDVAYETDDTGIELVPRDCGCCTEDKPVLWEWFEETYEEAYEAHEQFWTCSRCSGRQEGFAYDTRLTQVRSDSGNLISRRWCEDCQAAVEACPTCGNYHTGESGTECRVCLEASGATRCCDCGNFEVSDYLQLCTACGITREREQVNRNYPRGSYHSCHWFRRMYTEDESIQAPFFMGVEVEVDRPQAAGSERLRSILREPLVADIQGDGSLSGGGFEVITHAATLEAHREHANNMLSRVLDTGPSEGDAGMHVHVSRNFFRDHPERLMRLDYFINNNPTQIERVAKRESGNWAFYRNKGNLEDHGRSHRGRYEALNLQPNNTVEFRIFNAVYSRKDYHENLEFVHASVNWTARIANRWVLEGDTWGRFRKYVSRKKDMYPYLWECIKNIR